MAMPRFLSNSLAMNPNPSQSRSALVQRLLAQSLQQPAQSGSPVESLNIASKPLLAALLANREDKARGTREQGLAGALSRTSSPDPYKAEAARRASTIIAGGMPDNPLAQTLLGAQAQQAFAGGGDDFTLSQGQTRFNSRGQPVASVAPDPGPESNIPKLVNDISDDLYKESGDFTVQLASMGRVRQSAQEPSAAGDMALIFNYMKMLDPNSVVREAEYATAENARGVPSTVRNIWNRVLNGERLAEDQRGDFVNRAERLFAQARADQETRNNRFLTRATSLGVPKEMFGPLLLPLDPAALGGSQTAAPTPGPGPAPIPAPSGPPRRRIP